MIDVATATISKLKAGTWANYHSTTPGVWEHNLKYFKKNKEGILVKKLDHTPWNTATGGVRGETQHAEIQGWSKTDADIRDDLFEDVLTIIEDEYLVITDKKYDAPREHNFRIKVRRAELR